MTTEKEQKQKKSKPKYSILSNVVYMLKNAWKTHKLVLVISLTIAIATFARAVAQMLIAPMILRVIEQGASFIKFVAYVIAFTVILQLLGALIDYLNANKMFGKIEIRQGVIAALERKRCTTSFPNLFKKEFDEATEKSYDAVKNNSAATEAIWNTLEGLLSNIMGFTFYLILLSGLDLRIAAMVTVLTIVGFVFNKKMSNWEYVHKDECAEIGNRLLYCRNILREGTYAKEIRIFGITDWINELWDKNLRLLFKFDLRKQTRLFAGSLVDIVLTFLKNGIAYYFLLMMVIEGKIAVSAFILYFAAVSGYTAWVSGILDQVLTLYRQSLDISVLREFLEFEEPFRFEGGRTIPAGPYTIELRNVSYRYPEAGEDTIKNLNLTITPSEKIAIVGLNGAGKTTLIRLVSGFLDPTEGQVLLNGIDIREFNRREYYDIFAAVFQDYSVIPASIRENITQTTGEADEDKMKWCIEQAGLTEKIASLEKGTESQITRRVYEDGLELSGGETQRLMLARVLYKDAPFVLLDEPTAALDPIAENNIYLKYNEMTKGKQSIFISHRLASTRFCDRILYLEDGQIAEEGTHEGLMNLHGKYADIYGVQSKYYNEDWKNGEKDFDENSISA